MGKPLSSNIDRSITEYIGYGRQTEGTETSKYLEEKKESSISLVAASERERAQTHLVPSLQALPSEGRGIIEKGLQNLHRVKNLMLSRSGLERPTAEGKSPVREKHKTLREVPSTTGHEKSCGNSGGPPPKAKYYLATDSDEYREGKVKSTPEGE